MTRREWVKEDELAEQLKVHPKVMRRVLRYLEQVTGLECQVPACLFVYEPRPIQPVSWN